MSKFDIQVSQMGESAILIEWPQRIDESILEDVISFKNLVLKSQSNKLVNHTPAYSSLLLQYDQSLNFETMRRELLELYQLSNTSINIRTKEWHIPVCYHASLALDLESFISKSISHKDLIQLHTGGIYRVYMIGFLPGFLYLGGLPEQLHLPRKLTPDLKIPKGAIAIGGQQTGIYPMVSPGGWHVIGQTPLSLFDINSDTPTPIRQGDMVKFYEIDMKTYEVLKSDK
ncbi:MAG: inhibitor of KinA [Saprospiraceae bacterium]|jgi:inhibitor of KinA|tara:strand:- start:1918 stop:2604 length:687 start_codon:yes stop_codon:yes gene_type:complete